MKSAKISFLLSFLFFISPTLILAENSYIFSTDPQSVPVGQMSAKINVQSSSPVTETTYLTFTSSSNTGVFLNSSGNPLTSAYISTGDSNRAVYYKDTTAGDFIITADILSKEKIKITSITQHIFIGGSSSSDSGGSQSTTTNTTNTSTETTSSSSSSGASAHSSPTPLSDTSQKMEFEISAGRDRLTSVGSSITFEAVPTRTQNVVETSITCEWSFGDGTVGNGNLISHTYRFSGEYFVVVNASAGDKKAVSRMTVKVIDPKISVKRVVGGFEITNNSGAEINLGNWKIISSTKSWEFPKDTLIPFGKKVVFPDEVTGINSGNLVVQNPLGKTYAEISDNSPATLSVSNTATNTNDITLRIKETAEKIAVLSEQIKTIAPENKTTGSVSLAQKPEIPQPEQVLTKSTSGVEMGESSTTNTATVFEAPASKSFVSTIFAWPIAGVNFILSFFTEK